MCTNTVNSFSLTQVVPSNTHFSPSGASSLTVLAFISWRSSLCSCSTIPPLGTSDHCGLELSLKWKVLNLSKQRIVWRYDHADFQTANELLETVNWNFSWKVTLMWLERQNLCLSWTSVCQKTTIPTKRNLSWLSKELTKSICARNLAYKCAKKTGALQHFLSYKCKRN